MNVICMQGDYYRYLDVTWGYLLAAGFSAVPAVYLVSIAFGATHFASLS